jgi:restriction system protein
LAKKESLFQILLRQPWWVTLIVAFLVFTITRLIYPPVAIFTAFPFVVLCGIIAFKQFRGATPLDAHERLERLRAMDWEEFSKLVTDAYRKRGYAVHPASSRDYDFRLTKDARVTLLQCRRWKVNQVGVGPLRELLKAIAREDASHGICIAAGAFSAPAIALTATEPVTLIGGAELLTLVGALPKKTGV